MLFLKLPRKILTLSFYLLIVFSPLISQAQEETQPENSFSLSGQLRPRLEFRDGNFLPLAEGQNPAALISDRIRFTMDYSYKDLLSVRISPQSVGVWGQESMVQGAENSGNKIALFEAWSQLKLSPFWNVKLGRQIISLDDERFFGELDWAQGARAHDALSFQFKKDNYEIKSFFAYNQNYKTNYGNNLNNPSGNYFSTQDAFPYKWMQTIWAGIPVGKSSKLTFLFTNLGLQNTTPSTGAGTNFSQTYGANLFHTGDQLGVTLSAYYQGGRDILDTKTSAYLLSASANYKVEPKFSLGIGSDLLSGNDVGTTSAKNEVFNPYFHTGHKFYGSMDYFNNGSSIKGAGLSDTYLKGSYAATENLSLQLALHQFFTPNSVSDLTTSYNKNLGQEADLSFSLKVNKYASVMGGYSFYLTNQTLRFLKNTVSGRDYQQWAWLSINVTPAFFKTKW